jgi:hypothetical protein
MGPANRKRVGITIELQQLGAPLAGVDLIRLSG